MTAGLEPAASAVTALREQVLQQLTRHAGAAKRRASHTRRIKLWVGLWVGNSQGKLPRTLPCTESPRCEISSDDRNLVVN